MPRADNLRAQLLRSVQRLDPLLDVSIANIVVRSVDAQITGVKDLLLRKPGNGISVRVRDAEVDQFDPVFPIVEVQFLREKHGRRFQPRASYIRSLLGFILPAAGLAVIVSSFVLLQLIDHARVGQWDGPVVHHDLVAVHVVPMMMGVEREPDRFLRQRSYHGHDFLCAGGEIRVDHEDIIRKNHPSIVAVNVSLQIAFDEIGVGCNIVDFADFRCGSQSRANLGNASQHRSTACQKIPAGHVTHGFPRLWNLS